MDRCRQLARRIKGGDWLTIVVPAALIYLPLLATAPGKVGADTKTYLYLDPSRLLSDAAFIWHDRIGLGTVTHQNIGYLFPVGPFYWLNEALGVPDWVAQRLWLGSILFGAAMGVRYLLRTIGWADTAYRRGPLLVAALAYALSPYYLAYAARISVILLPWAALPWLIAFTAKAVRQSGWRYPAWFAFTVLIVGGINATALLLVGLGPLAWLCYAVFIERDATVRQALAAAARIGVLTLATSAWWIAGLFIQSTHGLPVLRYTETFKTVAESSTAPEVFRGLGYWFFYGNDKLGPWIEPSVGYTTNLWLLALSFALPITALTAAMVVRWRHRGLFAGLIMVGGLVAVGGFPWQQGSILGQLFTDFTRSDAGLSLRSTPRAVPLLALGTAVLLGAGTEAVIRRLPRLTMVLPIVLVLAVVANMPPLWTGSLVADNLQRDEDLPSYWIDAAAAIDAGDPRYRVLEVPGSDFAAYRWGNTVDPVTPGFTYRPWVARELFQYGSAQSANLLNAFDRRLHEDTFDPEALAPVARLMGVGDILVRSDLQYERYRIARPRLLWDLIGRADGLGQVTTFGPTTRNTPEAEQPLVDEIELATDPALPDPPAVAIIAVNDPVPMVRAIDARNPLLVSGDGEGVVDAAAAGILDANQILLSSAWFLGGPGPPAGIDDALARDADLLITDTNRRRAARWGTLRENSGYTEMVGELALRYDPTDQRLDVFPGSDDSTRTVTVARARNGATGATARATAWGNPVTLTPDDRPMAAIDGDPTTAWRVGAVDDPVGERLVIDIDAPVTTSSVILLQPTTLSRNRWMTAARLHFSDSEGRPTAPPVDVELDDRSRDAASGGQVVGFDRRTFQRLEVEVVATNVGELPRYDGQSSVGLAEVGIDGVATIELVRPPTDLLDTVGSAASGHRLMYLMTRLRSNPAEPVRGDPETSMRRLLTIPDPRAFSVSGSARVAALIDDQQVDATLMGASGTDPTIIATSSERLPGSLAHRASAAIDGDPATFWSSPFEQRGEVWLDFTTNDPVTFNSANLTVVADGRHSVPTRIRVQAASGGAPLATVATIDLPDIVDTERPNGTSVVEVPLGTTVSADHVRVVVEQMRQVLTKDWYSNLPVIMPVAIAEVDIDGLTMAPASGAFSSGCRDDLLTVAGQPVPVEVTGTIDDAVARRSLTVTSCDDQPLNLDSGEVVIEVADGRATGLDLDQLLLASDAGGLALATGSLPRQVPVGPPITVDSSGRVSTAGSVDGASDAYWLVQSQSWSSGFEAVVDGVDLGVPALVNGFATGWLVAEPSTTPVAFDVEWTPQRVVWGALGLSAIAAVVVLILMVLGRRRPRRAPAVTSPSLPDDPTLDLPPWSLQGSAIAMGTPAALATGVGVTLIAALNLPAGWAWLAPGLGIVAGVSLRWTRARNLPGLVAVVFLAAPAAFTVLQQYRNDYPPDFVWPAEFSRVHMLGVVALLAMGILAVRDLTQRRRTDRREEQ